MATYTFDDKKFLVILSGSSNEEELIKKIEIEINVTHRLNSMYHSKAFPKLLKGNPNKMVDSDGNITLSIQCPSTEGLAEVLAVLRKNFIVSPGVEKEHYIIADKTTISLNTLRH